MEVFSDPANRDVYVTGFLWILKLTAASSVFAVVLGTLLAAMRVSPVPGWEAPDGVDMASS